jgi:hypothetical protein
MRDRPVAFQFEDDLDLPDTMTGARSDPAGRRNYL